MKDIDFINMDLEHGMKVIIGGEPVDITEKVRACDHQLELTSGMPNDILGCPKCGWWKFAGRVRPNIMEKYQIIDKRS